MIALELRGGEDSLFTNVELVVGAVLSIIRDSDLKKADALCVEEALALSLQGGFGSIAPRSRLYTSEHLLLFVSSLCYCYLLTPSCTLADGYLYKELGEEGQFS